MNEAALSLGAVDRRRKRGTARWMRTLLSLAILTFVTPANAEDKPVLKLTTPAAAVRLVGAHCLFNCSMSGFFAPSVTRDNVTAVQITNTSSKKVKVTARFAPTNGLAMGQKGSYLTLDGPRNERLVGATTPTDLELDPADTVQLKLALTSNELPSGIYTGQLLFTAKAPTADDVNQATAVEIRIRDSAVWALLIVFVGILVGRLAQLVYDPKTQARVQLLDWLGDLETKVNGLPAAGQDDLLKKLSSLRTQLFSRGVDPASLQAAFQQIEREINEAVAAVNKQVLPQAAQVRTAAATGNSRQFLRLLAGATPLPLQSVYDYLLPLLTAVTLLVLTAVFMIQQYSGTSGETFGANGIADYAALFLAGVASDAIAGGLRAVKLRS